MSGSSRPPKAYQEFVERFPKLGEAWNLARQQEEQSPLDAKTARLIKLAVAVGAMREGAVHSATRKASRAGATDEEIFQVVAYATSTIGMPSAVAVFSWIKETLEP